MFRKLATAILLLTLLAALSIPRPPAQARPAACSPDCFLYLPYLVRFESAPLVTILAPLDGSSHAAGAEITFRATAIDLQDGDLSSAIQWSSNLDGWLGAGSPITSTLSPGIHLISAAVTDTSELPGLDTITLNVAAATLPDIRIKEINYDPPGDDLDEEYVRIKNVGGLPANMTGWTLRDAANHVFTFPSFILLANLEVKVWVKSGTDSGTDLYMGSATPIWNNTGDMATLRDASSQLIDSCAYTGGGVSASCD